MKKRSAQESVGLGRVLRRHSIYLMFFSYVTGCRDTNPKTTWQEAANRFMDRYNLSDEDIDPGILIREAQRITADFIKHGLF